MLTVKRPGRRAAEGMQKLQQENCGVFKKKVLEATYGGKPSKALPTGKAGPALSLRTINTEPGCTIRTLTSHADAEQKVPTLNQITPPSGLHSKNSAAQLDSSAEKSEKTKVQFTPQNRKVGLYAK